MMIIDHTTLTVAIPHTGRSSVLRVLLAERSTGYWIAWLDSLPMFAAWGTTRTEVLERITGMAQVALDVCAASRVLTPIVTPADALPIIDITAE
jgi:hypothetical protein